MTRRWLLVIAAAVAVRPAPAHADGDSDGWWVDPIARAAAYVEAASEADRPYSTPYRPRNIAGDVALSCEHQEGRPCGDGAGTFGELDSLAGYEDIASAAVRLRVRTGDGGYRDSYDSGVDLDRAHVDGVLGPFRLEAGRDVLILGPKSHTQLAWGDNAPPIDQVKIATRPLALTDDVHAELLYVVGQFRDPQTYPGDLVTVARAQLDLGRRAQLGLMQLLQDEGTGAPHLDFWDFLLENVRRKNKSASLADSSNRRFGGDASVWIDGFGGARLYYQLVFEDIRSAYWYDAVRYDADHLLGIEMPAIHDVTVELEKTGVRSQEHTPRLTGFTSGGFAVGSPLGPDAQALYASARWGNVTPWIELAQLLSDTYKFIDHGPILHETIGLAEYHARAGARATWPLRPHVWLETDATVEYVENEAYVSGARRENVVGMVVGIWQP